MNAGTGSTPPPIVSERDWTDRNAHDPGVTLVQLFVWLSTALMVVIVLRRLIASLVLPGCGRDTSSAGGGT
jgi:hypothetical protein